EARRREEEEAFGKRLQAAGVDDERPPLALARPDERHAEARAELGRPGLLGGEHRIGTALEREPALAFRADRAAEAVRRLEQHHVGTALHEAVRGGEPRHAAAD